MNGDLAIIGVIRDDSTCDGLIDGRVYPDMPAQGSTLPRVFTEQSDADPHDSKSGTASVDTDLVSVFIEGISRASINPVASAIRDAVDGYSGTINSVTVQYIRFMTQSTYTDKIDSKPIKGIEQVYEVRTINTVT